MILPSKSYFLHRLEEVSNFTLKNIKNIEKNNIYWIEKYDGSIDWVDKILAETALLLLIVSRNKLPRKNKIILSDILTILIPQVHSNKYKSLILRNPQHVFIYGLGHIALKAQGFHNEEFDFIFKNVISTKYYSCIEKVPYRTLDNSWLLHIYDKKNNINFHKIEYNSILNYEISPYFVSRADAYAYTHTIFYLSDFGNYSVPEKFTKKIKNSLSNLILWSVLNNDLDLLGELLICSYITYSNWNLMSSFGNSFFFKIWDKLDFLYGPSLSFDKLQNDSEEEVEAHLFQNIYHTYYVGGLLCSIAIKKRSFINIEKSTEFDSVDIDVKTIEDCRDLANNIIQFLHSKLHLDDINFIHSTIIEQSKKDQSNTSNDPKKYLIEKFKLCYPDCQLLLDLTEDYGQNGIFILQDSLLIFYIKKYDILSIIDVIMNSINSQMPITNIFKSTINFILSQRISTYELGTWSLSKDKEKNNAQAFINLKIATCLLEVYKYFEKSNVIKPLTYSSEATDCLNTSIK